MKKEGLCGVVLECCYILFLNGMLDGVVSSTMNDVVNDDEKERKKKRYTC